MKYNVLDENGLIVEREVTLDRAELTKKKNPGFEIVRAKEVKDD